MTWKDQDMRSSAHRSKGEKHGSLRMAQTLMSKTLDVISKENMILKIFLTSCIYSLNTAMIGSETVCSLDQKSIIDSRLSV